MGIVHARRWTTSVGRAMAAIGVAIVCGCAGPAMSAPDAAPDASAPDAARDTSAPDAPVVTPLTARFRVTTARPALLEIPFPSDVYRDADGAVTLDPAELSALRVVRSGAAITRALHDLDGFARNAGAVFALDGTVALDPASLTADTSALLVDLDPALDPAAARTPVVAGWQPRFHTVTVAPDGVVLRPGARYAAVLTTTVRATDGTALAASDAFAALRDARPEARASDLGRLYGAAIDRVATVMGPGFDRTRIVAAAVFTTHTRHTQLLAAAEALRAGRYGAPPAFDTDATLAVPFHTARFGASAHAGWTATLDAWLGAPLRIDGRDVPGTSDPAVEGAGVGLAHDALGAVITGTAVFPDFRGSDGAIVFGTDGAPAGTPRGVRIPVTVVLPRGPAPAAGFPVVIWGHGLRNHRRHMLVVANEFARRGLATIAIDTVTFGQRADPTDETSLEAGSYRGPDGIGDQVEYTELPFFGGLTSLVAFRDNLRQAALDLVSLRRMLAARSVDLGAAADEYGTAPTLDPSHVAYAGDSLGGLIGTLFGACEPDVNPLVLNVPGGAIFTAIGADSAVIGPTIAPVTSAVFGTPGDAPGDRFHPLFQLLQTGIDAADPASLAASVTDGAGRARPHDVWLVEALWDEIIPNRATELLARAMGVAQTVPFAAPISGLALLTAPVTANGPGGATLALSQVTPSTHGADIASRYGVRTFVPPFPRNDPERFPRAARPWRVRQPVVALQRHVAAFIADAFAGHATVAVDGLEPLVDADDDGFTDDEEQAAGTDPFDPDAHPSGPRAHVRDVGF